MELPPLTLLANTELTYITNWLEQYTRTVWLHSFPTEKGRITLQRCRTEQRYGYHLAIIGGFYIVANEKENTETAWPQSSVIEFKLTPLSDNRTEIEARCHQPLVAPYFLELLVEMAKRWPEAKQTVSGYMMEPALDDGSPQSAVACEEASVVDSGRVTFRLETDAGAFLAWLHQHIKAIPKLAPSWFVEDIEGGQLATCGYFTGRMIGSDGEEAALERLRNLDPFDETVNAERHRLGFKVLDLAPLRVQVHAG
mgnify:CR=1 FL=1